MRKILKHALKSASTIEETLRITIGIIAKVKKDNLRKDEHLIESLILSRLSSGSPIIKQKLNSIPCFFINFAALSIISKVSPLFTRWNTLGFADSTAIPRELQPAFLSRIRSLSFLGVGVKKHKFFN